MCTLLVHNPNVGSEPSGEELLAALDAEGFSTTYCSSKNGKLDEVLGQPAHIVIVAGATAASLRSRAISKTRKTLIAILPVGTANHIAAASASRTIRALSWKHGQLRVDDQVFEAPELASNIIVELEPAGLRVCVPAAQD